jgi:hypothetical protein
MLLSGMRVSRYRYIMYVCIRGGLIRPLHRDLQWSIVLNRYTRVRMELPTV